MDKEDLRNPSDILNIILELDENLKEIYLDETTPDPLIRAIESGDGSLISKLAAVKDEKDSFGITYLYHLASKGDKNAVQYMVLLNADVNIHCTWGYTALHVAAENGFHEVVQSLIMAGAEVNSLTDWKETPLHLAAANNHFQIAEYLLNNQADVMIKDIFGNDAIDMARKTKEHEKIFILLTAHKFKTINQLMDISTTAQPF